MFVLYDGGEGDSSPWSAGVATGMPQRCWRRLDALSRAHGIRYGQLRLLNAPPCPPPAA